MLRKILMSALTASTILTGSIVDTDAKQSRTALFVLDMSSSPPLAVNTRVAGAAGNTVQKIIARMKPGDAVKLRTLGTAGIAAQQITINAALGTKAKRRPRRIAKKIGNLVRALPRLVKAGKIDIQPRTNIIGFVESIAPSLNCARTPTTIVIFSDGIE